MEETTRGDVWLLGPCPPTPKLYNLDLVSNIGLLGSGRRLKRRGAPIGTIWVKFQLKWGHGDPLRDRNHVFCETSYCLVVTNYCLVGTNSFLVVTNEYLVVNSGDLVVGSECLVVTSEYLVLTSDNLDVTSDDLERLEPVPCARVQC